MTKITELGPTSLVNGGDKFVIVQNGTTHNVSASALADFVSGDSGVSGGGRTPLTSQWATPYLQKTQAYGIPKSVSVSVPGSGYTGSTVLKCVQQGLVYTSSDPSTDATPYLARGMEVLIETSSGGSVSSARIVQPGQLYRIGDTLEISNTYGGMSATSPNSQAFSLDGDFTPAIVQVTDIEPMMVGHQSDGYFNHLGSCTPWVQSAAFGGNSLNNVTSWTSDNGKNPLYSNLSTVNLAAGDFVRMELDWSATIQVSHSESNAQETRTGYLYSTQNYFGIEDSESLGIMRAAQPPGAYSWGHAHYLDIALPGTWFVGGATFASASSWTMNDINNFGNGFLDESERSTASNINTVFPTNRFLFNQWQFNSSRYAGMPAQESPFIYSTVSDSTNLSTADGQAGTWQIKGMNLTTPVSMTVNQIRSSVRDKVEGDDRQGVVILGSNTKRRGVFETQKQTYDSTDRGRTQNPNNYQTIRVPSITNWSKPQYYMSGFYLFNISDVIPKIN